MVVTVQQPSVECTAIFIVCFVYHRTAHLPAQWQYTKPALKNRGTGSKTVPASKIQGQCADNTPNTFILAIRPRTHKTSNKKSSKQSSYQVIE